MGEIITIRKDQAVTSSLQVAKDFEKRHDTVLRAIEKLVHSFHKNAVTEFMKSSYKDEQGRTYPIYYMNKDAFSLLVIGFTGDKALAWKLRYYNAFTTMEKVLTEKQKGG